MQPVRASGCIRFDWASRSEGSAVKNIGLTDFQRREIEALPNADEYIVHGLLDPSVSISGRYMFMELLDKARKELAQLQFPTNEGLLEERRGRQEVVMQSPLSVGLSAGKWCSYAAAPDLPGDQREEDGGSLIFSSDPLKDAMEIAGRPVVELELSVDKPQAMIAVRLSDVGPAGKATGVTYGLLNLTHRDGDAEPSPLEPHKRYRVRVALNGIAQHFPAGNVVRVSIATSYWPVAWAPPEPVNLTVYPSQSALILPIRDPRPEDDDLRPFEEPVVGESAGIIHTAKGEHNWVLHKDLA